MESGLPNMIVTETVDPGRSMVGFYAAQAMPSHRMGTVEVGAVPTSDRLMGWRSDVNFKERPQWKNLFDGEGRRVGYVNGLRGG